MVSQRNQSALSIYWGMVTSTFVGLVLMLVQLPQWLFYVWPDWVALIVMYWALVSPKHVGPIAGFVIGIILEVLFAKTFGVTGLGMATLVLLVSITHLQFRVTSRWQQMVLVGLFTGFYKLLTGWLYGLVSDFTITSEYWYSILGNVAVWPFLSILLDEFRHLLRIR